MWQSPVIVTPPASEPVALAQVKEFLRIDEADDAFDTEVAFQIAGARDHIESLTSTRLIEQIVDLQADSFGDLQLFKVGPIVEIEEISYVDRDGVKQTVPADAYELFGSSLDRGARPVAGARWPTASKSACAITVRAKVGYGADGEALPASVRMALLLKVRSLFEDTAADIDFWLANDRIWL